MTELVEMKISVCFLAVFLNLKFSYRYIVMLEEDSWQKRLILFGNFGS